MSTIVQSGAALNPTAGTRTQVGTTITTAGTYELHLDTSGMANGDTLVIEVEVKPLVGGTRRVAQRAYYANVQGRARKITDPEAVAVEIAFFVTKAGAGGLTFDWSIQAI